MINGLVRMMDTPYDVAGPVNIGNPTEFSIRELAEIVIEITGSKSQLVRAELPSDDPRQRQPDIQKAKTLLDWRPKIQLREGIERTVIYFDALLRA